MAVKLGNGNWAVKEDKLLAYNDNSGLFFNKEFDFSRGTSATYVAKDGFIKTAGIQSNVVNNGDFSELGSELVINGTFDTDSNWSKGTGWSISGGSANCDGTQTGSTNLHNSTDIGIVNNKFYKVVYTISNYVSGSIRIKVGNTGFGVYHTSNGTYTQYLKAVVTTFPRAQFNADANFIGSIDNVSVKEVAQNWTVTNEDANNYVEFNQEEGTARLKFLNTSPITTLSSATQYLSGKTYKLIVDVKEVVSGSIKVDAAGVSETFNSVGIQQRIIEPTGNSTINFYRATADVDITLNSVSLQEIQTDTPRIDFTNDTKGHLLLEPSRTNSIPYSEDFTTYNDNHLSIESNTQETLSPQGIYNATKFTATGTDPYIFKSGINVTANTQTASIYVKGVGNSIGKQGRILFWYIGTAGGSSTSITFTLTSDWQRVEGSSTPTSSGTLAIRVDLPNVAEVGDESYVYGFQMEEGSYATSYIPTTGAASTRNADLCNNSGSAQDFNSEEGVLYAEVASLAENLGGSKNFAISDGTNNNVVKFVFRSSGSQIGVAVKSNGTTTVNNTYNMTVSNFFKMAFKFKQDDCALWVNGTEIATDTSATMPLALNTLRFDRGDGGNDFIGKVRNLQVFTEALTDEQLQELTS